jgi:hypothetical protein
MTTNGSKARRSQKDMAVERLIEQIEEQILRHQIAIRELDELKSIMRGDQYAQMIDTFEGAGINEARIK